jgi:hypothetical protein
MSPTEYTDYGLPGFPSSRSNWVPLTLDTQANVAHPSVGSKGEDTIACGVRVGGDPILMTKGQTLYAVTSPSLIFLTSVWQVHAIRSQFQGKQILVVLNLFLRTLLKVKQLCISVI